MDYEEYYAVYMDSVRRWGDQATSIYPYALFENIRDAEKKCPEAIKLWLARVNGRVGAGALVFYQGRHAVSWHAATGEDYYAESPANALQMAIIEDAFERGFSFYDLNPSGGHKGTERFKIGMGAVERSFTKVNLQPGILWKLYRGLNTARLRIIGSAS
jgi:CelD/BcsL family acetyltransferase involved in cellulose biosynthesis